MSFLLIRIDFQRFLAVSKNESTQKNHKEELSLITPKEVHLGVVGALAMVRYIICYEADNANLNSQA